MLGGGLFSRYFLDTGIRTMPEWSNLSDQAVIEFVGAARASFSSFHQAADPNEAVTEERLIFPIIRLLGWDPLPQQQATRRREEVPDALLFIDGVAADAAMRKPVGAERYRLANVVHESKRWDLPLDRPTDTSGRTPASQVLRYLRVAEELSNGRIRWAMLSNGRLWRLYAYDVTSQAERYLEADLAAMLELGGETALRVFLLLFRKSSFVAAPSGRNFLQAAIDEAREWQQAVTARLSGSVFDVVFPELLRALSTADSKAAADDAAWPERLRDAALVLLYRLLFVLYAEDRDLLPVGHDGYRPFSITNMRREINAAISHSRAISSEAGTWWPRLRHLFGAIAGGNDAMGLPPYNGGLFSPRRALLLDSVTIPDAAFAKVLDGLSMLRGAGEPAWINYRDLSVQQLGAIYEGLLELGVQSQEGVVVPIQNDSLRHGSGAYFTPEPLVQLVMRQAVAPLLAERRESFGGALARVSGDNRSAPDKLADLQSFDIATAFLNLKICDPAMGSGHFLVSLIDWLADETLIAMEETTDSAVALNYRSPLAIRIAEERARIDAAAALHGWPLDPRHLDDRQIVRRLLLKRVIYGVDLNPLAVELTKLSLWLHSFTVGAPLSYLDHHLRVGNSLFGAWIADTEPLTSGAGRRARRGGLALAAPIQAARSAAQTMEQIEDLSDGDIAQVRQSAGLFHQIEDATQPLRAFLDCLHALIWLPRPTGKAAKIASAATVNAWLDGLCGDPVRLASGVPASGSDPSRPAVANLLEKLRALARQRRFLHWQAAFPGVWQNWQSVAQDGGFDAIIGNPPYVRQELLAPLKQALKARYASYNGVADLYVYFFEQASRLLRPGGRLAFTVTNKWLKAGYAEALRGVLTERLWVEAITDFGHAKGFFPGTDVFPSVLCARRPLIAQKPPTQTQVTVVPRDRLRMEALEAQVAELAFYIPTTELTRQAWILEPSSVRTLLRKIRQTGSTLSDYVGANSLYRGVLTGLNEAFVVDTPTRDRLIAADANSADILRPFLRGQDIDRWSSDWAGLWMIFTRRGTNIDNYPAIRTHLESFRSRLEPQPADWNSGEWQGRKAGNYHWFEIQDNIAYFAAFEGPKIVYTDIAWSPQFSIDHSGALINNTAYIICSDDPWVAACLNSPLGWWFAWRAAQHGKDEALRYFTTFMESFPIPHIRDQDAQFVKNEVALLGNINSERHQSRKAIKHWLMLNFDINPTSGALISPFTLSADQFTNALRASLPRKRRTLSSAAITAIQAEHAATIAPMSARIAEATRHEVALSALVNRAYELTQEEEALLWATAPPRMPISPPLI